MTSKPHLVTYSLVHFIKNLEKKCFTKDEDKKLGWKDSNLRMAVPKTAALPLGDTPTGLSW